MKQCPYCAESIQDAAVVCRYCNRELSAAKAEASSSLPPSSAGEVFKKQLGITSQTPKWQLGCLAIILVGGALSVVSSFFRDSSPATSVSTGGTQRAPSAAATSVDLTTLLDDYKGNEVGADAKYKNRWIRTTGVVGDIKKDILDRPYVTVGHGRDFEVPEVQCMLASSHTGRAAALKKGQSLTVKGKVQGLMMNVLMEDCTF